jgi:hypothetical protein
MPLSISSSDGSSTEAGPVPGQGPYAHHGPLAPGLRLTASDRPGIAQPVPERDVPPLPWAKIALIVLLLVAALTGAWEWRMRSIGYEVGDLGDDPSAWAEQRRKLDSGHEKVAIVGDSRILFDTNLDRFQQLTGIRPVQLAIAGSNALPVLEDIANRSRYNGLVIVGIADQSYFRKSPGAAADDLKRGIFESPDQRVSFLISRFLRRYTAMLDGDASLHNWVIKTDPTSRSGVHGPYGDVWKVSSFSDDRQTRMWTTIPRNTYLRNHAIAVWMAIFGLRKPTPDIVAATANRTKTAVAKIRARGGEVVFVRPPSADPLHALEEKQLPRAKGWDVLLKVAQVKGIHFLQLPDAQGLTIPEKSHLNAACAVVFTDAYVRALTQLTPRLRLAPNAPPVLHPQHCNR